MNFIKKEKDGEPLLRINTKKYNAVLIKDIKPENAFIVTTAKKSRIKTKVRCEECDQLYNQNDLKLCVVCSKKICFNCANNVRGSYYCKACLNK